MLQRISLPMGFISNTSALGLIAAKNNHTSGNTNSTVKNTIAAMNSTRLAMPQAVRDGRGLPRPVATIGGGTVVGRRGHPELPCS